MHIGYYLSWLHPILVHFPIVLLLSALVCEFIGYWKGLDRFSSAARGLLAAGCVISLFAFVSGNFAEVFAVRGGTPHAPVDAHGIWAMITTWLFILLTVARFYLQPDRLSWFFKIYLLVLMIASGLLIYTAHQGGCLVFDHGANVGAVHEGHALDMQDLKDLYQEQTHESIIYSEMMHHIFGWLVFALSLFLIASKLWPQQTHQLWRGGPYVLLVGGVFLMIFSDTDSWPLSNARPIYDKEVLQHKIFSLLMLVTGGFGLFGRTNQKVTSLHSSRHQLGLALLALVGGGLLFTHVHSVAPYSNRAIGVYLHHLTMGMVALCAGATNLWEFIQVQGPRWRTYLWPAILLIESFLLITYNEDIPRFISFFSSRSVDVLPHTKYHLDCQLTPQEPLANQPCQLRFQLMDPSQQQRTRDFEVVHEHPLHLIVVSKNLSFFDHVHPILQSDGSFILDYRFAYGGDFILFADLVPKGKTTQTFRIPIHVKGLSPPEEKLCENAYETVHHHGRDILLFTQPLILSVGQKSYLKFGLYENEKGLSDLKPFLGCFGHCIIVSEDTSYFQHTHPEDHNHSLSKEQKGVPFLETVVNAEEGFPKLGKQRQMMYEMGMNSPSMSYSGPEVIFPAFFPKSGLYKIWGQFRHREEILTIPFVVRVP